MRRVLFINMQNSILCKTFLHFCLSYHFCVYLCSKKQYYILFRYTSYEINILPYTNGHNAIAECRFSPK